MEDKIANAVIWFVVVTFGFLAVASMIAGMVAIDRLTH